MLAQHFGIFFELNFSLDKFLVLARPINLGGRFVDEFDELILRHVGYDTKFP